MKSKVIVGRKEELQRLEKVYLSKEAEFVVMYGRRRVGKTHLIREHFKKKQCVFFHATGIQKGKLKVQLTHFSEELSRTFTAGNLPIQTPTSWEDAFKQLDYFINNQAEKKEKTVIFLDELPWMATPKSGLLEALDYYWNRHWSQNKRVVLIVCGSSAAWLIKKIIYNQGGLHNRCTCEIKLAPFTLKETSEYLKNIGVKLNNAHILSLYMVFGGVPYYLKHVNAGLSASQNIQKILFDKNAPLADEFNKLFASLFKDADDYIELIEIISRRSGGMSRSEIEANVRLSKSGGRLTLKLNDLIQTNFLEHFIPWTRERGEFYKVIDEFSLFYMRWLANKKQKNILKDYWLKQSSKPTYYAWAGYAFEAVCHKHINNVIKALHIKTAESVSSWRFIERKAESQGAQIDLLIDRSDDAITVCEIKYTTKPFAIDKAYARNLENKVAILRERTRTKKEIFIALISANGLKENQNSEGLISSVVVLDDLFC